MAAHPMHSAPTVARPRARKATTPQQQQQHHSGAHAAVPPPAEDGQWRAHSELHFAVRKQMIGRLQRLHPLLATNSTMQYANHLTRIPELVQRLELMLYKAAASLDEYTNVCTLERRVHALVTLLEPLPAPVLSGSLKRRGASTPSSTKRRRRSVSVSVAASTTNRFVIDLSADLLSHVFAFLDGVDILQHVAMVDRSFCHNAPRLVTSLAIDVGNATHARALHGRVDAVLSQCVNLTTLTITNGRNVGKKPSNLARTLEHPHGGENDDPIVAPPPSFVAASDPTLFTGRVLLHELAALWRRSSHVVFPKLQRFELRAPFDCANESDATLVALDAMAVNASKAPTPTALQVLVLDTTALGDRRIARLMSLSHSYPLVFSQELRVLDVRNNFVGEAGIAALTASLASGQWRRLETLGLARNVLTDSDADRLAHCLAIERLAHLDVSENFIGKPGFQALATRLSGASRVAVDTAHNCMEGREAAHLFMAAS